MQNTQITTETNSWLSTPVIAEQPAEGAAHGYALVVHDESTVAQSIECTREEFEEMKARLAELRGIRAEKEVE